MRSFDISFIDLKNKQGIIFLLTISNKLKFKNIWLFDFYNFSEEPKRENVFYIEFPPTWEAQNIYDLFSSFGSVFIGWIDDTSAYVALQNPENTKKAAGQLVGVSGREYRVYFYSTYQNQMSKSKNDSRKLSNLNKSMNESLNGSFNKNNATPIEKRKVNEENEANKNNENNDKNLNSSQSEPSKSLKKIKIEYIFYWSIKYLFILKYFFCFKRSAKRW